MGWISMAFYGVWYREIPLLTFFVLAPSCQVLAYYILDGKDPVPWVRYNVKIQFETQISISNAWSKKLRITVTTPCSPFKRHDDANWLNLVHDNMIGTQTCPVHVGRKPSSNQGIKVLSMDSGRMTIRAMGSSRLRWRTRISDKRKGRWAARWARSSHTSRRTEGVWGTLEQLTCKDNPTLFLLFIWFFAFFFGEVILIMSLQKTSYAVDEFLTQRVCFLMCFCRLSNRV